MISFSDASARFNDYLKKKGKASATILAYSNDIAQLTKFLSGKGLTVVSSVNTDLLEQFKTELALQKYTAKSVSRKINSIKTFFRFLKGEGVVENDPALSVSHPKYEIKPPRILSKTEYRALRDACRSDSRVYAIVELMLQTGIRIGEVANLRVEDLSESEIYIQPFESHLGRHIPLNQAAKDALKRYIAERPSTSGKAVFVTKTGRSFLIRNIRSSIERYFEIAEIKNAKVNDLRHTWIFHHLSAGTPLMVISKLAGHKRLSTTEKYLTMITTRKESPVKLEEL